MRGFVKHEVKIWSLAVCVCAFACLSFYHLRPINDQYQETDEDDYSPYQEVGLHPYDPPIEATFVREIGDSFEEFIASLPDETLADNRWTRLYEEVLGVRIRYDWTAKGDMYRQKLGVSLASGNIPDIVEVNALQLRLLSNMGLIQNLTEVYEEYATDFTKMILTQEGNGPFEAATIDGKLMGIPETDASLERAMVIWIRSDWLDALELAPPQTIEDVTAISKAFTEGDPDGNGLDDTYGLALAEHLWDPVAGVTGFMAGFGAYPEIWLKDHQGKLIFGGVQPEVKDALQALQNMYKQGWMDPEFGYKNGDQVRSDLAAGKLGIMYGEQWGSFHVQGSVENFDAKWQAYPIVSSTGERPKVPLKFSTSTYFAVRKDYEYPEAVVKLFNLHLEKNWGKTAEYGTFYNDNGAVWSLSPVTPFPARKNLEAYRQLEVFRETGDATVMDGEAQAIQRYIESYKRDGDIVGWGWERTYGPDGAFSIIDQYEERGQLLYDAFTGAPTETMIEKQAFLRDKQHETYMNIILGSPISEFDRFVEEWRMLGGDQITAEVNEWFAQKEQRN